ncbi:DUF4233 domain-containing protein [Leucobacter sp. UT-8R-CII-1-4]|uniref:DUF4233 domain-containing protein n=1 Tax=Leucobacter sp. UT-8R-CII-1-4 TaxID=3040075 RepID=UPI0024A9778D|nr:DUF4233 domain-containing protein [Leucobacter sp. UT-8R-CII-1-4]MDI6024414.1 DUF4233 domain-containing protein [Leucobacter sp. UT-8R-CII-1-4]
MSQNDEELQLSPSETAAHNAAMRLAGAGKGEVAAKTQRALASITLGFELIVVVLIGLAIFGLSLLEPRELGLWIAGGMALACVLGLGFMRVGKVGIWIGWGVHVLMLATAFILPMSLVVSLLFTALWVYCMIKGAQIDRGRAAYYAENGISG